MKEKLAIVGCATETRDDVDYSDPNLDIWVFNESAIKPWCKRADAVFQLHPRAVWENPLNAGDKGHGDWLKSGDTPTVYMLEQYPDVPKCVRYPKDEIVEVMLPNFTVDSERGRKDFFTSTIAYAIALGIYLGYKEIHTFGIELADEDEYRKQQPAAMFWTGIAIGRGVKFVSHSKMFDAPLYPTETFVGLDKKIFSDKVLELEAPCNAAQNEYARIKDDAEKAVQHYEDGGEGQEEMIAAIQKRAKAGQDFGILDGARQENQRIYEKAVVMERKTGTYIFSRHEFARDQAAIGLRREGAIVELQNATAEVQRIINRIEPKTFDSHRRHDFKDLRVAIENYVKAAVVVGMYTGAINEDERFISLVEEARKNIQ